MSQRLMGAMFLVIIFAFFLIEKRSLDQEARAARKLHEQRDKHKKQMQDFISVQSHHIGLSDMKGQLEKQKEAEEKKQQASLVHGDEAHELPPKIQKDKEKVPDVDENAEEPPQRQTNKGKEAHKDVAKKVEDDEPVETTSRVDATNGKHARLSGTYQLDYSVHAKAAENCPLPPLHPQKWEAKFGWGVRKDFPKCNLKHEFSKMTKNHEGSVDIHFYEFGAGGSAEEEQLCDGGSSMKAYGFDELENDHFRRMTSTLDAEMRQNELKDMFSMSHPDSFAKTLPRPKEGEDEYGGKTWSITNVKHTYIMAVCGKHHELHVRDIPGEYNAPKPKHRGWRKKKLEEGGIQNFLHIMFDSTSIYALRRGSKKIVEWMEQLNNKEDSPSFVYPMKHYHAVSCCSPGNQIPVYSGNMNGEGDYFVNAEPHPDSNDWLWNIAAKRGFKTFWSLDNCPDKSARDYHAYPSVHSRVVAPLCVAGVLLSHKTATCLAGKTVDEHVVAGLESFWERHKDESKFAAVQFITPHEETEKLLIELDDLIVKYFKRLEASGALNNTAVIFWSDHGINFGRYASTHDGEIEKMFPFINVILPRWFSKPFDEQLRANADRLVTPYDVYEAGRTILYHPDEKPAFSHDKRNPRLPTPGESHIMASFRKPITPLDIMKDNIHYNRTCMEANIPMEFCTCIAWKPTKDAKYKHFGEQAVKDHKKLLANYTNLCETVVFENVLGIEVQMWPTEYKPKGKANAKKIWMAPNRDMVKVQYRTKGAGAGIFEAVYSVKKDDEGTFDLAHIDRLDAMQKKCGVVNKVHEQLCVCK